MNTETRRPTDYAVLRRKADGQLELVVRGQRLLRAPTKKS